jgi:hypothetical protein
MKSNEESSGRKRMLKWIAKPKRIMLYSVSHISALHEPGFLGFGLSTAIQTDEESLTKWLAKYLDIKVWNRTVFKSVRKCRKTKNT